MISFEPTPDQKMMKDSVADFARTRLAPKIREVEKARALADQVKRDAFELGLALAPFAERVGGAGLGLMTTVLLEEEIAYGDPAAAFGFGGPGALGFAVTELGTEEQAKELLAHFGKPEAVGAVAWSEASAHKERPGLIARATKNGSTWTIDGEKSFVINASTASHFIVFAQVDESAGWNGTAAFVVENRAPGVSIGERATTLGLDVMSASTVSFKGVQVTESARLAGGADYAAALLRFFLKNGLIVASRCVGLARAAFDVTHAYVQTRKAFGKPIGAFSIGCVHPLRSRDGCRCRSGSRMESRHSLGCIRRERKRGSRSSPGNRSRHLLRAGDRDADRKRRTPTSRRSRIYPRLPG